MKMGHCIRNNVFSLLYLIYYYMVEEKKKAGRKRKEKQTKKKKKKKKKQCSIELKKFSAKGQKVNILGFCESCSLCHGTQHCHHRRKAAPDNTCMNSPDWIPLKLYLQNNQWAGSANPSSHARMRTYTAEVVK